MMRTLRQKGFTLTELIVAMALGLLVVGATIAMYVSVITTSSSSFAITRLDQELQSIMTLVTRDLRRAGYWGEVSNLVIATAQTGLTLPATSGTVTATMVGGTFSASLQSAVSGQILALAKCIDANTDGDCVDDVDSRYQATIGAISGTTIPLTITSLSGENYAAFPSDIIDPGTWTVLNPFSTITLATSGTVVPNCILFTYDQNKDGVSDPDELFGFRLNATDNTLEIRQLGAACDDNTSPSPWVALNDPTFTQITGFAITPQAVALNPNAFTLTVREYQIVLTGQLFNTVDGNIVTRTLQQTVRVRNEGVI